MRIIFARVEPTLHRLYGGDYSANCGWIKRELDVTYARQQGDWPRLALIAKNLLKRRRLKDLVTCTGNHLYRLMNCPDICLVILQGPKIGCQRKCVGRGQETFGLLAECEVDDGQVVEDAHA